MSQLRKLDREIVQQLNERAKLVCRIHESSMDASSRAFDRDSDTDQLGRAADANKGPLAPNVVQAVFREIISGCRELISPTRVAYLGPPYSYSHLAATHRFGHSAELIPVSSIAAVFEEVEAKAVHFGLVPLENSTDGRITDTLDMFTRLPVRISGEVQLRIHHNLLSKCPRDQIVEVCSKPQALSQCRKWLSSHLPSARVTEMPSTTAAAERAAKESGVAAIASKQAGINYGLRVSAPNIEDNPDNVTRFALIGNAPSVRTGSDITSLLFQLSHEPGALADAMAVFKRNRLNLTWIESFPLQGATNEYLFFVELEGYESDLRVRRAIASLEKKTKHLDILGCYARSEPID